MRMQRSIHLFLVALFFSSSSQGLSANLQDTRKLAVLPTRGTGITQEELSRFTEQFENLLAPQTRYIILRSGEVQRSLEEARFSLADATSSNTLAEAAKILGAERVLQGSISRRGKLFNLLIRIVDASSAEVVYNKSWEHVGEFDELLSKTNEMADDIGKEELGLTTGWKWYTIGAVSAIIVAGFYIIIKNIVSKDKADALDAGGGSPPPGPTN
jgi:TolB-like protein